MIIHVCFQNLIVRKTKLFYVNKFKMLRRNYLSLDIPTYNESLLNIINILMVKINIISCSKLRT